MLSVLTAGALVILLLVRLLGLERSPALVLLVGALPLTLLPGYAVLVAAVVLQRRRLALAASGLVAAHLLVVAPGLGATAVPQAAADAPRLRVVTANLHVLNADPAAAGRALRGLRPDVLVVPELSAQGLAGLRESGLLEDLPHAVAELGDRAETVGLLSRLPLRDTTTRTAAWRDLPRATVDVGGVPVRVLASHPLPPVLGLEGLWRESLADLAGETDEVHLPLVVAGDLNADRDHAAFRALLATGLRDAHDAVGRGLVRTWPAGFPLLHLDHVLVRDGQAGRLVVLEVREQKIPGTDHLAVVADLAVLGS